MNWKKILTVLVAVFCFLIVGVIVKAYLDGEFESVETLQIYIKSFGLFAPLILIVIQALQVIIPILPGFLGCAVGAVLFVTSGITGLKIERLAKCMLPFYVVMVGALLAITYIPAISMAVPNWLYP